MKLSPTQLRVLRAVVSDNLQWRWAGSTTRIRWYLNEDVYRVLTGAERKALHWLIAEDNVKSRRGWHPGIGGYEVTPKGRALLEEQETR